MEPYRQALEEELKSSFAGRQGFLYDLLQYHLGWTDQAGRAVDAAPPRHFQAMLSLATCEAVCGDFRPALPGAAAVELVYSFTLVHGEVQAGRVEDQDRPSIWWVWGPAQAINAGDGLHALGRAAVMRLGDRGIDPDRVLQGVAALDRACLTLCEGQYLDLSFQDQLMVTAGEYLDMIGRKAGALSGCAALLGALAAGAGESRWDRFQDLGAKLGMAWQIGQDLNDLWGRSGDGVTPSNLLNKKKSLPLVYALERAGTSAKRELGNIYFKRVLEPEDIARVIAILEGVNARSYSEEKARDLVRQALAVLAEPSIAGSVPEERRRNLHALGEWALSGQR